MYEFNYLKPSNLEEALTQLSSSDDGKLLAGGMTLLPTMKQRLAQPSDLIDLGALGELQGINATDQEITIGAMTTHANVAGSSIVRNGIPALADVAGKIGDPQVRNRGTLGGSIANADPAADYPAAVLALHATVVTNQRGISADAFFVEMFETALEEAEIITAVRFQIPKRAAYAKFHNPASRYAVVGVMVSEGADGVRVAVTGAGPTVFRAKEMEDLLNQDFSAEAIANVRFDPENLNQDLHASAEYRAHLITVMAQRAVAAA